MTFFGAVDTDGTVRPAVGLDDLGRPIFLRGQARNFLIVVEARPGSNGFAVGQIVFRRNASDPTVRPDLEIESSRALGNGSALVCDKGPGVLGGVPGIDPPDFVPSSQGIADALNDFACRFVARVLSGDACTRNVFGNYAFVSSGTTVQFCFEPAVGAEVAFPVGDTVLTVRVRDLQGGPGDPAQIVVRVPAS